jgi:dihydrofolate synthase/folylpolyglutamate synthase
MSERLNGFSPAARLHPKAIDLSLDRMLRLLADLGDPQDRLPP